MTRVRLPGIAKARATLRDGTVRVYWYAWRGGPRLPGAPGSPEFVRAYYEAHEAQRAPRTDTVGGLIEAFRQSVEWGRLTVTSRYSYDATFRAATKFHSLPLAALADPRTRTLFRAWRDGFAATPRAADYHWSCMRALFAFGIDQGLIRDNPCRGGGRLWTGSRKESLWSPADLARLEAVASEPVWRAVRLALATGQRQGDLLAMTWTAWDGQRIRWTASKTGRRVAVLLTDEDREWLDGLRAGTTSTHILTHRDARPWTSKGFRGSFSRALARAGIEGLVFHDLRGTCATRDYAAGATVEQIAARYGWSITEARTTLEKHYLGTVHELGDRVVALRRSQ